MNMQDITDWIPFIFLFLIIAALSIYSLILIRRNKRKEREKELEEETTIPYFNLGKGCPDCGGKNFLKGPTGGMSMNVKCSNPKCGSEFNWTPGFGAEKIHR